MQGQGGPNMPLQAMTMEYKKDLSGAVLHDTYRLVRKLAQGGMGELYEAEHARLAGKRYAVKLLLQEAAELPEMVARFRREAEITSELGHPNIVEVLDFHETEAGRPFLVMEFLEGEDLGAVLQRRGRLSPAEVVVLVRQVGDALAAAHAHGVVHRDMKPENIYISPPGEDGLRRAKVLDFGISKIRHSRSVVTREHSVLGTPYYMSPEQAIGEVGEIDQATDIFALGTICYLCLTGRLPFDAPTMPGVIYKICHTDPMPAREVLAELPAEVDVVLGRALAKAKADRHPSMEAFVQALVAALESAPGLRPAPVTARGLGPEPPPASAVRVRQATTLSRSAGEQRPARAGAGRGVKLAALVVVALVLSLSAWAMLSRGGGGEGGGANAGKGRRGSRACGTGYWRGGSGGAGHAGSTIRGQGGQGPVTKAAQARQAQGAEDKKVPGQEDQGTCPQTV
jgi:serine/threonine protein kinase